MRSLLAQLNTSSTTPSPTSPSPMTMSPGVGGQSPLAARLGRQVAANQQQRPIRAGWDIGMAGAAGSGTRGGGGRATPERTTGAERNAQWEKYLSKP